jgi:mRNA interferase HicA
MSVQRRELVKYLEENEFRVIREGGNHTIYSNGFKIIPVKKTQAVRPYHSQRNL